MLLRLSEIKKPTVCKEPIPSLNVDLGYKYRASLDPTVLTLEIEPVGAVHLVKGFFPYKAQVPCSRCLLDVSYEGTASFFSEYRPASEKPEGIEEIEVTDENAHLIFYEDETLRLDELVEAQMFLEIPAKPLCDDNCKGLCFQCGTNLNESDCQCPKEGDPRWTPLASLSIAQKE
jgi:uncharacterized protein